MKEVVGIKGPGWPGNRALAKDAFISPHRGIALESTAV